MGSINVECTKTWYYHLGLDDGYSSPKKEGWYDDKEYFKIEYVKRLAHDFALAIGDIVPYLQSNLIRVENAEDRIIKNIEAGVFDENIFRTITYSNPQYSGICSDYNLRYSGSGRIDVVTPEFDIVLLGSAPIKLFVAGGKLLFNGLRTLGRSTMAQMAKLGYKLNVVGADVVICTQLNVEIAKFGSKGLVLTNYLRNAPPAAYQFVDELCDISYVAGSHGGVGRLKLWKAPDGKIVWEIAEESIKGVRSLSYIPTSGTKIIANPNKTTTLLGRWTDDMESIKKLMSDVDLNVGTQFGKVTTNKGGFNFLDIPDPHAANALTRGDFFELYNKPWLDAAIQRGDDILLVTIPKQRIDVINIDGTLKGNFAKELEYLINKAYKPINVSDSEWIMIKSWF